MCALLPGAMGFLHHVEEIIFYLPDSPLLKSESSCFCCILKECSDCQRLICSVHFYAPSVVNPCIMSLTNKKKNDLLKAQNQIGNKSNTPEFLAINLFLEVSFESV